MTTLQATKMGPISQLSLALHIRVAPGRSSPGDDGAQRKWRDDAGWPWHVP